MTGKIKILLLALGLFLLVTTFKLSWTASAQGGSLPAPRNLTAVANGTNVVLNWAPPLLSVTSPIQDLNIDPQAQSTEDLVIDKAPTAGNLAGLGTNTSSTKRFMWLNKLTPSTYPATLTTAEIAWAADPLSPTDGVKEGQDVTLLVFKDPNGSGPAPGQKPDFSLPIKVILAGMDQNIASYDVSAGNITIGSGSFVVGVFDDKTGIKFPATIVASLIDPPGSGSFFSLDGGATFGRVDQGFPSDVMAVLGSPSKAGTWVIRGKALVGAPSLTLKVYNIYRSTTTPVPIKPENKIGSVDGNTLTFTDPNVPGADGKTVFYYVITGVFDNGMESGPSNEAMVMPGGVTQKDFSLAVTPASQTVTAGSSTSFTINAQGLGGFTDAINLSVALSPSSSNITTSLSSNTVTPGSSSTLTVSTTAGATAGSFTVTVTGTAGQIVHTATTQLNVVAPPAPDFSLAFDQSTMTVKRGQKGQFTVNINRTGGFAGNVTVTAPDTKSIKINITPPTQSTTGASVSFNFKVKKKAPTGTKQLTFTGKDDSGRVRTAMLTLTIQ